MIVPSWWPSPEEALRGIFFTDYARAFAEAGAKVGVVYPDLVSLRRWGRGTKVPVWPKVSEEPLDEIPVIRIRALHTALGRPGIQMRRFRGWLRRGLAFYRERYGEPDVLHAMCAIPAGWACTHLDDSLEAKVVVTEHTGPFSLVMEHDAEAFYVGAGLAKAAAVVAVSAQSRTEMQSAGIDREIQVCGNCVADAFLKAGTTRKQPGDPVRALFVGRLVKTKGLDELIEAAIRLATEYDVEWHFAGDGPMGMSIRRRLSAEGMQRRFKLYGNCDRHGVIDLMNRSDFLVLPSHGETFGMVVAEALCMGLPVVTTRETACADFINKDNGILVNKHDVDSLVEGLRSMIDDHKSYDRDTIAERARSIFSPKVLASWYAELFRNVTRGRSESDD